MKPPLLHRAPPPPQSGARRLSRLGLWIGRAFGQVGCLGGTAVVAALGLSAASAHPAWGDVPVDVEDSSSFGAAADARDAQREARAAVEAILADRSNLPRPDRARVARAIVEESAEAQFDPVFVLAVMGVESDLDGTACSNRGAHGLMQLRDRTAAFLAEKERLGLGAAASGDPALNVRVGVRYLSRLQKAFGDMSLALIAYNAGPHRVSESLHGGPRLPARFSVYPRRVRDHYHHLLGELSQGSLRVDHPLSIRVAQR